MKRVMNCHGVINRALKAQCFIEVHPPERLTKLEFRDKLHKIALARGLEFESLIIGRVLMVFVEDKTGKANETSKAGEAVNG